MLHVAWAQEEVTFSKSGSFVFPYCGCCSHRMDFFFFFPEKVLEKIFFNEMLWGM